MFRSRGRAGLRVAALALAGAVMLVACGGDDDDGGEAAAPAGGGVQTVRLANFGHLPATLPYDNALAKDLFTANGVKVVENPPIYNAAEAIQTLFTGDADMGYIGISAAIQGVQVGRDVKVVAVVAGAFPLEVALTNQAIEKLKAKGVTESSPIKDKVSALRGLTLASPAAGSTTDLVFRYAIDKYGVNPDRDVTIKPVGDAAAIVAAARQGAADGVIATTGGPTTLAVSDGFAKIWINFAEQDQDLSKLPIHVLVTSTSFLKKSPAAVSGVVKAFFESRKAIESGLKDSEMVSLKQTVAPQMDQRLWNTTIETILPLFSGSMAVTEDQYKTAVAVVDIGADSPTTVKFNDVIDNSIVKAIGAS